MTLQELISSDIVEKIDGISLKQVSGRMVQASRSLMGAETLLKIRSNENTNTSIFTLLYDAGRIATEAFLLLKGVRALKTDHHKKVFQAGKELISSIEIKSILSHLDRMRRKRNEIDYDVDLVDIPSQGLDLIVDKIKKLLNFIREEIKKDPRYQTQVP